MAVGGQISSNPCLCFSPTAWAAPGLHLQGAPGSEREPAHGQGALGGGGADLQRVHPAQEEQRRPGGTHQTQGVVHGHPLPVRCRHCRCRESETKWVMLLIPLLFFSTSHPLRSKFITFIKKLRVSAPRRNLYFNLGWNHFLLADMFLSSLLPHLTGTTGADDPHFTVREAPQHRAGTTH